MTKEEYEKALKELEELLESEPQNELPTEEEKRKVEELVKKIEKYEREIYPKLYQNIN